MATDGDLRRQFELMGITPFGVEEAMSGLGVALRYRLPDRHHGCRLGAVG